MNFGELPPLTECIRVDSGNGEDIILEMVLKMAGDQIFGAEIKSKFNPLFGPAPSPQLIPPHVRCSPVIGRMKRMRSCDWSVESWVVLRLVGQVACDPVIGRSSRGWSCDWSVKSRAVL
jgi:hypothetical protein